MSLVAQQQRQTVPKQRPTAQGLGITTEKPKFPQYAQIAKRFESYQEFAWPENIPIDVKDLVEGGLVYTGVGDSVRCYYCGGGLRNWEKGDNPIVEHARWYPNCPHVLLLKGRQFIQRIADGESPEEDASITEIISTLVELVECPAAQAVIQMGYSEADVRKAIRIYQQKNGQHSFSGTELYCILIDMEENPNLLLNIETEDTNCVNEEDDSDMSDYEEEVLKLSEENERLKEIQSCKICTERLADIIFLPCGHMVCCPLCAPALAKCPICRKVVNGQVKAVFATTKETQH